MWNVVEMLQLLGDTEDLQIVTREVQKVRTDSQGMLSVYIAMNKEKDELWSIRKWLRPRAR